MRQGSKNRQFRFIHRGVEKSITVSPILKDIEGIICNTQCSYSRFCQFLKNPMNPESGADDFANFCSGIKIENDSRIFYPAPGSIERTFPELFDEAENECVKEYIGSGRVSVSEVIDKVCPSICPHYSKDYKMCKKGTYMLCLLKMLLESKDGEIL